jgi:hypothetical protein
MEENEQVDAFAAAMDKVIMRYIAEFDIGIHAIVGVLEEKKIDLLLNYGVEFIADEALEEELDDEESTDDPDFL